MASDKVDRAAPKVTTVRGGRLARRLFGSYVFQTMNWGIRLLEQLLLIPLFIVAWGADLYRDWIVVTAAINFLSSCSFGTDEYFGNLFLRSVSTGAYDEVKRQVRVGLFIAMSIALLILALLYGGLLARGIDRVVTLSAMSTHEALLVAVIMTLPLSYSFAVQILRAAYRAYGDFNRGECIFALYISAQLAVLIIVLALRQPPVVAAICYSAMSAVYSVIVVIDVCRRYADISLGLIVPTREEWRRIVPQSLMYFTNPLSLSIMQNATLFIFGLFGLSAAAIVSFNVLRIFTGLTRAVGAQAFAVGSGIEMARQHLQNDHEACRSLYADSGRIGTCLAGLLAGLSIPFSVPFVKLWTHGAVGDDIAMVSCFLAGIFLSSPGRTSLMLLRYTNHAHAIAIASCAYAIGGFLLSLLLVRPLGAFGVALSFAVTETLAIGLYPPAMVASLFRFSAARHLLASYAAGAGVFMLSYLMAEALFASPDTGPSGLVIRLGAWACIAGPLGVLIALSPMQRRRLFSALARRRAPWRLPTLS